MARVDFDPAQMAPGSFYPLLTSLIVPRPIAWVSTQSADGTDNLAPHSFFTVSSAEPPVIQFTSVGRKDSLRNIDATGEFVVSFAPASLMTEINETGTDFPPHISEFDAVGLKREPSLRVKPPRVAASPAAFECKLAQTVSFGSNFVVMGHVVHAAISEGALRDGRPAIDLLGPATRLGGIEWGVLGQVSKVPRIPYSDWAKPPGDSR